MPSVLVLGASRGIGREFVSQYLAEGWTVHATARKDTDLAELKTSGAHAHKADTTDEGSLSALADAIPDALDIVIVNAGISTSSYEPQVSEIDSDEWAQVMQVNALGPLLAARNLGAKIKRPGGTLAVLSSVMGSIAENEMGGVYSYRMSKAALNAGLKSLSLVLEGEGVGIIALHPGWVQTDMGGPQATVTPSDSVDGLRRVMAKKAPKDGQLFVDYKGNQLPW